ncbi:MAG: ParA family protein [Alistipes sp.]|nr:ParA family protein [Alistipes sp.]
MENKTVYVSIANQKGGTGKSTLSLIAASYLNYVLGYKVLFADMDYPQCSSYETRVRELNLLKSSDQLKARATQNYSTTGFGIFPIIRTSIKDAIKDVDTFIKKSGIAYDIVFFDMPGTTSSEGIYKTLARLDYIFVPMKADRIFMESTLAFASTINEHVLNKTGVYLRGLYMFWNMIDKRERTHLYDQYEKVVDALGLPRMEVHIPQRIKFSKEVFTGDEPAYRTTILPPEKKFLRDACIDEFVEEMLKIMNI